MLCVICLSVLGFVASSDRDCRWVSAPRGADYARAAVELDSPQLRRVCSPLGYAEPWASTELACIIIFTADFVARFLVAGEWPSARARARSSVPPPPPPPPAPAQSTACSLRSAGTRRGLGSAVDSAERRVRAPRRTAPLGRAQATATLPAESRHAVPSCAHHSTWSTCARSRPSTSSCLCGAPPTWRRAANRNWAASR